MGDSYINHPKSPKYYVKRYLDSIKEELSGKIVIDFPAGNGTTTEILMQNGAIAEPYDLFPEYFLLTDIECKRADIMDSIPVTAKHADMLICQEGIEHFSDQLKAFKEFNRVLKPNGKLLITTPSYSSLASKMSYLLFESETNKTMPPNEINDIWMSDKSITHEIYHGHLFLIGLQKLRVLAKLAGFRIKEIRYIRLSKGSLTLFPFFYPLIIVSSYLRYYTQKRKHSDIPASYLNEVFNEQLSINTNPRNLLNKHTFIIFEKETDYDRVDFRIEERVKKFKKIM